jgi:uncharacterized delta-60 repeat protein
LAWSLAALGLIQVLGLPDPVGAAPGDLDPTFGTGGKMTTNLNGAPGNQNDRVFALVIQSDGKMLVGGRHLTLGQFDLDFALVRYNADGTLDGSFGNGGKVTTDFNGRTNDEASALVVQPDGKIVAAGYCGPGNSSCSEPGTQQNRTFALARYNVDGSLDTSFGNGGKVTTSFRVGQIGSLLAQAYALTLQPDGKIVAAGEAGGFPNSSFAVIRYNPDGTLDGGFGTEGKVTTRLGTGRLGDRANAVAVQPDGKIIAAGFADFSVPSGPSISKFALARYNPDGTVDSSFGVGGKVIGGDGLGKALALQPDGKILLTGVSGSDFAMERYNSDGRLDSTFGIAGRVTTDFKCPPCGSEEAFAIALQPNGKILVAGYSDVVSDRDFALVRYNPDGSLDATFGSGGKVTTDFGAEEIASAVAVLADGNIVAAGSRCVPNCLSGTSVFALARYQGGPPSLVAAVLPGSRSVQVGTPATAFSTIIATGGGTATGCSIAPATVVPATFLYQTTDPVTNLPTGSPNAPADIRSGGFQTFVMAFTPTGPFGETDVRLAFDCTNTDPAGTISGVNTVLLSSSVSPVADIVALAASSDPGIVNIPGPTGTGAFAVATVNVGVGATITASADVGSGSLPVSITLCQTNPTNGVCLAPLASSVPTQINSGETPTFGIFVTGSGAIPFDPANNRVFVRFKDAGGVTRGATSVAVRTQ